jgi:Flp pilus assembly protein TadG
VIPSSFASRARSEVNRLTATVSRAGQYRSRHRSLDRAGSPAGLTWRRLSARLEAGSALVWVAVTLPLFVSLVGLAIDGGVVFNARRELQNVADAAARAGAMQIDEGVYRASSGATVVLAAGRAEAAAWDYLEANGSRQTADVRASSDRVVVTLTTTVSTAFLRLVGVTSVPVEATAPAEVRYGVDRANR